MPRPVKTDRPVIAEPVVEPLQGNTIVVIHPGSSTLQLGRATDHFPQSIPHVIARKILDETIVQAKEDNALQRIGICHADSEEKRLHGYKCANILIQAMRISAGYRKPKSSTATEVASYNSQVRPVILEDNALATWTDLSDSPDVLIGEQVLNLNPAAPYSSRWPIAYGKLNLHDGLGGSIMSVAADLEALWGSAIETFLDIPIRDLNYYRAVLIVPDLFDQNHVKVLVDVVLNKLKFSCVIVNQESVCGIFGSGFLSACVVDVGSQKTSICCVEDGISLPSTRLTLNYGGDDITRCFFWLLQMSHFPYRTIDADNKMDIQLLHELKETFCHLSLDISSGQVHEFQVMKPNEKTSSYKLRLGDEPILAPTAMFIPDLFGVIGEQLILTFPETQNQDSMGDLMDDRYLLEKRDVDTKKTKGDNENESQSQEFVNLSQIALKEHSQLEPLRLEGMPLDEAIMYSIEQCSNQETKRKMYSTILLIGGGLAFKGGDEFLLKRLQTQLPSHYQFMKDQMEVIARPKENDPRAAGWKGGTVLSILDSAQELWISRKEWNRYGSRILRERCAFQWSSNMDKQ